MPSKTIPTLGQYGLVMDQAAQEIPDNAFSSIANVRFRDGMAERVSGHVQVFDTPSVTPYWIAPYGTATARYWIHSGIANTYADDGTTRTDITGSAFTGAVDDRFTGGAFNGLFIINNGIDQPKYWDGNTANNLATLTAWDSNWRVKFLRPFKNYLIYGSPTKSGTANPHTVGWSAAADPGTLPTTYDPASTTTDAGDVPIGDTPDQIVDGLALGEVFLVYKEASIHRMEYVGGQFVFSVKRLPGNFGMLARGCGAITPKGHLVLGNGDIFLCDGVNEPQSILTGRMKRTFFTSELDSEYSTRSFVVSNPSRNEVWVCYPPVGETTCTRALIWNWVDNTIGMRDLPSANYAASGLLNYDVGMTFDDDDGTYDDAYGAYNQDDFAPNDHRLIFAASKIYLADSSNYFDTTAISMRLERTGLAFGDPDTFKTMKALTPRLIGPEGTEVSVQFGGSPSAEIATTWRDPVTYTIGQSSPKVYDFVSGRFLAYRISSSSAQGVSLKSIDIEFEFTGKH